MIFVLQNFPRNLFKFSKNAIYVKESSRRICTQAKPQIAIIFSFSPTCTLPEAFGVILSRSLLKSDLKTCITTPKPIIYTLTFFDSVTTFFFLLDMKSSEA